MSQQEEYDALVAGTRYQHFGGYFSRKDGEYCVVHFKTSTLTVTPDGYKVKGNDPRGWITYAPKVIGGNSAGYDMRNPPNEWFEVLNRVGNLGTVLYDNQMYLVESERNVPEIK